MENKTNNTYEFDTANLLVFLYNWRKQLIIISVLAAVTSIIVSFLIAPKFKSSVVMFPSATSSISKALISENDNGKHDLLAFGEEEEAEQLLQVLNSDDIRNQILKKYNLFKHYDIDTSGAYVYTNFLKQYNENISFRRTKFQSVQIDVLDTDPVIAANIANDIASLLDSAITGMQRERALKGLKIVENQYVKTKDYLLTMQDSMTVLRELGVQEYEVQVEQYTQQYSIAIVKGKLKAAEMLQSKLDQLAKYGGVYVALRNNIEYESEKLSVLRSKYEEAKIDAQQDLPHKFIVNNAFPAEKKTTPIRWLIVVVSTLSAFMMGVIVIIALENYKKLTAKS